MKNSAKFQLMGCVVFVCGLTIAFLSGCASEEFATEYSTNTFYMGQPDAPHHGPRRANVDFFNRSCEKTGFNSYGSTEFTCHYNND
jgi:hypothetical protein